MILIIITKRKVKEKMNGMDVAQIIKNERGKMIRTICVFFICSDRFIGRGICLGHFSGGKKGSQWLGRS